MLMRRSDAAQPETLLFIFRPTRAVIGALNSTRSSTLVVKQTLLLQCNHEVSTRNRCFSRSVVP